MAKQLQTLSIYNVFLRDSHRPHNLISSFPLDLSGLYQISMRSLLFSILDMLIISVCAVLHTLVLLCEISVTDSRLTCSNRLLTTIYVISNSV